MLAGRRILLIIGGGIAAYKSLELIRLLQKAGAAVTPVLTAGGAEFVTPLTVSALARTPVHQALFDLTAEATMGHIELSRAADLVVVAPATADLIAKLAHGHANDLASTLLLATDKRVLLAPAMNVRMWLHPAMRRNLATARADGALVVGPDEGELSDGEFGPGRMAEPPAIVAAIDAALGQGGSPGATCSSPRGRPTSRSTRCASSPTARPAARAPRSPRRWPAAARGSPSSPGRPRRRGRSVPRSSRSRPRARCSPPSRRRCRPTPRSSPPPSPTGT